MAPVVADEAEAVGAKGPGERRDVDPQATSGPRRFEASGFIPRGSALGNADPRREPGRVEEGPGFSKTFSSVSEFLSSARAELARLVPPTSDSGEHSQARELRLPSGEEALGAHELKLAVDEELLYAWEQRVASREKELERRQTELEDEERRYLGTIEELQIRMERDEDRFEQGLENVASWARSEVENDLRAKSRAASSLGKQVSKL